MLAERLVFEEYQTLIAFGSGAGEQAKLQTEPPQLRFSCRRTLATLTADNAKIEKGPMGMKRSRVNRWRIQLSGKLCMVHGASCHSSIMQKRQKRRE